MVLREDQDQFIYAASLSELAQTNCLTARVEGHTVVLFKYGDSVYAVDNRCPHMGFPLNKGTVKDGILTCHWHHARFDVATGGTFDQWADDVPAFPVKVEGDDILLNLTPQRDMHEYRRQRLRDGLERNISLLLAKSVIGLLNHDREDPAEPFRMGIDFGTRYRQNGWGQGLTILGCMMKLVPHLNDEDKTRALYHGLSAVANDTDGSAPRFPIAPLPGDMTDIPTLKRWFRQFIEVRDSEAGERCIVTAVRAGATSEQMADMLFSAATDHRYIQIGHPLDFINKALESLDIAGWDYAEWTLASLVTNLTNATRMEETNEWRYPVDLVDILEDVFDELPDVLASQSKAARPDFEALVPLLLGDDPAATAAALLDALKSGVRAEALAGVVTYAAALRIARFHTSNEFGDWDTALHTFTFSNAVHQGLRRVRSVELVRGIFDSAMSIYLDRFLNIPAAKLPTKNGTSYQPESLLDELPEMLNLQQQVNEAGNQVGQYLFAEGDIQRLIAMMGKLLLREDRDFHTIQSLEAAVRQYYLLKETPETAQYADNVLIAAARYLAAHSPTMRAQGQTYNNALRLSRGEALYAD